MKKEETGYEYILHTRNMKRFKKLSALLLVLLMVFSTVSTGASAASKKKSKTITVSTQAELNKALKSGKYTKITLSTDASETISIKKGNYPNVNLIIEAPNAKISNMATTKKIFVNSAKKLTEKASGNTYSIRDDNLTMTVASTAEVAAIKTVTENTKLTLTNNGKVGTLTSSKPATLNIADFGSMEKIAIKAPTSLKLTGITEEKTKVTVYSKGEGSTIKSSNDVNIVAYSDVDVKLNKGAEASSVTVKKDDAAVNIDNNTKEDISVTTADKGTATVGAGEDSKVEGSDVVSNEPDTKTADDTKKDDTKKDDSKKEETKADETKTDETKSDATQTDETQTDGTQTDGTAADSSSDTSSQSTSEPAGTPSYYYYTPTYTITVNLDGHTRFSRITRDANGQDSYDNHFESFVLTATAGEKIVCEWGPREAGWESLTPDGIDWQNTAQGEYEYQYAYFIAGNSDTAINFTSNWVGHRILARVNGTQNGGDANAVGSFSLVDVNGNELPANKIISQVIGGTTSYGDRQDAYWVDKDVDVYLKLNNIGSGEILDEVKVINGYSGAPLNVESVDLGGGTRIFGPYRNTMATVIFTYKKSPVVSYTSNATGASITVTNPLMTQNNSVSLTMTTSGSAVQLIGFYTTGNNQEDTSWGSFKALDLSQVAPQWVTLNTISSLTNQITAFTNVSVVYVPAGSPTGYGSTLTLEQRTVQLKLRQ